jgi:hypothetical protein
MGIHVKGLQTNQLVIIAVIVDVLVRMVRVKIIKVCRGIVGDMPTRTPMAAPPASDLGLPFNLMNLR